MAVFHVDAQLVIHVVGDLSAVGLHIVEILHIFWLRQHTAVDINLVVNYFQGFSRQTYAALHIVVAAVNRAIYYVAIFGLVGPHLVAAHFFHERVVVGVGAGGGHGVAGRKVKHHYVKSLHIAHTL